MSCRRDFSCGTNQYGCCSQLFLSSWSCSCIMQPACPAAPAPQKTAGPPLEMPAVVVGKVAKENVCWLWTAGEESCGRKDGIEAVHYTVLYGQSCPVLSRIIHNPVTQLGVACESDCRIMQIVTAACHQNFVVFCAYVGRAARLVS
jgi:hypothetical protein